MIYLTIHEEKLRNLAKVKNILIPKFRQIIDREKYTPVKIKEKLKTTGLGRTIDESR